MKVGIKIMEDLTRYGQFIFSTLFLKSCFNEQCVMKFKVDYRATVCQISERAGSPKVQWKRWPTSPCIGVNTDELGMAPICSNNRHYAALRVQIIGTTNQISSFPNKFDCVTELQKAGLDSCYCNWKPLSILFCIVLQ